MQEKAGKKGTHIKESSKTLREFLNRRIDGDSYPAMVIDGMSFGEYLVIVVLGIKSDGTKKFENANQVYISISFVSKDLLLKGNQTPSIILWNKVRALAEEGNFNKSIFEI